MKTMRVPRSGSMILSMFVALIATALLPVVFMAALAASAETHPRSMGETLKELGRPLAKSASQLLAHFR
ncbi:MAG: hypothetical protein JWN44_620 [Myxococcales bacterium]|nr:hypothetical protein [Myxococcales bacterium]